MPITFPTPTTIGEQFASGGKTWQWNGYAWNSIANASALGATGATGPSANLSNYVLKAGDTMTGKLNLPASTTTEAGLNIGNGVNPTSPVTGDAWISTADNLLKWRTASTTISAAASNLANSFSVNQTIQTPISSTVPALRVTQRGTGEALRVEDDTSPDTTAFVISSDGRVGVGVAPDTSVCLSLDTTGVKFGDGTIQTTATIAGATGAVGATGATGPTADLSGYVLKSGDTMTGKLTLPASTTVNSSLNIPYGNDPTSPNLGDIWATSTGIRMRRGTSGSPETIDLATLKSNTFTAFQTINASVTSGNTLIVTNSAAFGTQSSAAAFTSTGTSPTVLVTQNGNGGGIKIVNATGAGESLRIEDESPDTTPFVVSATGRVGVGVIPDATVALSVDTTGIKFGDNIVQTKAVPNPNVSGTYTLKSIDGVITWVLG